MTTGCRTPYPHFSRLAAILLLSGWGSAYGQGLPFVEVQRGPGGVSVRAPFIDLQTGPFGTRLRAPFTNLDVPGRGRYLPPQPVPKSPQPVPGPMANGQPRPVPQPPIPNRAAYDLVVSVPASANVVPPGREREPRLPAPPNVPEPETSNSPRGSSILDAPVSEGVDLGEPQPLPGPQISAPGNSERSIQAEKPPYDGPFLNAPQTGSAPPSPPASQPSTPQPEPNNRRRWVENVSGSDAVLFLDSPADGSIPPIHVSPASRPLPAPPASGPQATYRLRPFTIAELFTEYRPRPGINVLALFHPQTGQPICLPVRLTSQQPIVRRHPQGLLFQDGPGQVVLTFRQDGMVGVAYP